MNSPIDMVIPIITINGKWNGIKKSIDKNDDLEYMISLIIFLKVVMMKNRTLWNQLS